MLQLVNPTPLKAAIMLLPDLAGVDTLFTVLKATFTLGARVALAEDQVPVALADQHYGEPGLSSVRVPSDVCIGKPSTDILLVGSAWAPGGRATWQMDVSVAVGPVSKSARVFGDRVWDSSPAGATLVWVAPFERMPLVWERAYGGTDQTERGPTAEPRNPVGLGFRARDGAKPLAGLPAPNVEDPASPISSWKDTPPPAGFAPIAPHWEPRKSYAGTYDETWQKTRAPYLPNDFDPRFFQLAPPGLSASGRLQGGELVDLRGVTPDGVLQFTLPSARVHVVYRLDTGEETRPAALDTIILEPDAGRLMMVWSAALPCDKAALKVREIEPTVLAAA
jgi:hypothetical protein